MGEGDIIEPPWRAAAAQVLVGDLDAPELASDDLHHFSRVLRLRPGSTVCATDGDGGWRLCSFTGAAALEPQGEGRTEPAPQSLLTVGSALVKGSRPELVVQKLTELGIDRIVLFSAARSVVRWDASKAERQVIRLRRVAREACAQSRRLRLPVVGIDTLENVTHDSDFGSRCASGDDKASAADRFDRLIGSGAVLAEAGGRPLTASDTTVLIGPEGGWDAVEVSAAAHVSLSDNVLRAETAAITAGALMSALRANLVKTVDTRGLLPLDHPE